MDMYTIAGADQIIREQEERRRKGISDPELPKIVQQIYTIIAIISTILIIGIAVWLLS